MPREAESDAAATQARARAPGSQQCEVNGSRWRSSVCWLTPIQGSAQALNGALAGAGTIPGLNPNAPVKVLPVRGNIYVLMGAGAQHHAVDRSRWRADG